MSQPSSELAEAPSVLDKKPAFGIYNALLLIAVICLAVAFVFLMLQWGEYGFNWKPNITA